MPVHVKICGITRLEDAVAAIEAGADSLGFVFFKGSPRRIDPDRAAEICTTLPARTGRVGVFVNAPRQEVEAVAARSALTAVQLHGEERREEFEGMMVDWYRAFRVRPGAEVASLATTVTSFGRSWYLLDTHVEGAFGGSGRSMDWRLAAKLSMSLSLKDGTRLLLAGGLTPENVAQAVRKVRPWGVDVSSGVESAPGIKDHARMIAFVAAARGVA